IASDVASGSGKAPNQAVGHGISHAYGDNWDRTGSFSSCKSGWSTHRHDHINAKFHKLFGGVSQPARPSSKVFILDHDILPLGVAILAKPVWKTAPDPNRKLSGSICPNPNEADNGYVPRGSLRIGNDWVQCCGTSNQRDELASSHASPPKSRV